MIYVRTLEQNDALVALLEDARGNWVEVSEPVRGVLEVIETVDPKNVRITYVDHSGKTKGAK